MYNKSDFQKNNPEIISEFIQRYPLAFVYAANQTGQENQFESSLLPILLGTGNNLITHLARRNPLLTILKKNGGKMTLQFFGPQRYISPQIYQTNGNVPTWNYSQVEVTGTAVIRESKDALEQILKDSVAFFETRNGTSWSYNIPDQQKLPMLNAISGLEIQIETIDNKFKLNQNRLDEDQEAVRKFLNQSSNPLDQEMLYWMQRS